MTGGFTYHRYEASVVSVYDICNGGWQDVRNGNAVSSLGRTLLELRI